MYRRGEKYRLAGKVGALVLAMTLLLSFLPLSQRTVRAEGPKEVAVSNTDEIR